MKPEERDISTQKNYCNERIAEYECEEEKKETP